MVKQISVFVENAGGKLAKVTTALNEGGIDIRALSIADTTDFGILRLIVKDPDKAVAILQEKNIMVKSTDVIVVEIDDEPGGLNKAICVLRDKGVALEYLYAFAGKKGNEAYVIMKTDNEELAAEALSNGGIRVLEAKEVYAL